MSEGMLAAITGLAALLIGLLQWFFAAQAASRQRDVEMTTWGGTVIDLMAELETACDPISSETRYSARDAEVISHRASALVDRGRLFFPNVGGSPNKPDDEGIRVRILDQVLRACYVARHLVRGHDVDGPALRGHIWQARRRFVELLQKEMGRSLRKVGEDSAGDHVPADPRRWPSSSRPLNLPPKR